MLIKLKVLKFCDTDENKVGEEQTHTKLLFSQLLALKMFKLALSTATFSNQESLKETPNQKK